MGEKAGVETKPFISLSSDDASQDDSPLALPVTFISVAVIILASQRTVFMLPCCFLGMFV